MTRPTGEQTVDYRSDTGAEPRRSALAPSGLPYAAALLGGAASTVLTYRFVGAGARELNPVMRALIDVVGLDGMIVVKMALLVSAYWAYAWLRSRAPSTVLTAAAWAAALIHLGDGLHDARVALRAQVVTNVAVTPTDVVLFGVLVTAGVVLWPRWRAPRFLSEVLDA